MGDAIMSIDIELVCPEITACSQAPPFLPTAITEDVFDLKLPDLARGGTLRSNYVSIIMDNLLSLAHTLVQIMCQDHKGLLYDIMRTLKDYNIQRYRFGVHGAHELARPTSLCRLLVECSIGMPLFPVKLIDFDLKKS
ncbi:ACT domain-containing protein ACR10 [Glycine soja]|uniref:ACT domain-containing protein ACR n=1 Tax=Glycine soja TaxID=3848 RepID=A0A445LZC0_GLYSO|nr:ACT domain-containing protein ACR10 [Glycine soja]